MPLQLAKFAEQLRKQPSLLVGLQRGLEKESLRMTESGALSSEPHPKKLGSALTHAKITTDYAESLLEFITPVHTDAEQMLAELRDIQRYVYRQIGNEQLWPMSMPCFVDGEDAVQIAKYGKSNIGRMKTLYREGLRRRYGSMMQVISGVHFNFSLPDGFWQWRQQSEPAASLQERRSQDYFALIRNFRRHGWIISYLFGASPALCGSFVKQHQSTLPFERTGKGTLYLPHATSLRMSDLGYTNHAQAKLRINYDSLQNYVDSVHQALNLPHQPYADIGVKVNGEYRQLNSKLLQIENELYAPIRPKCVANSGEHPSQALLRGGVEYIEVRSLDVNPFASEGISLEQIYFLDIMLISLLLMDSPELSCEEMAVLSRNMEKVVLKGRKPGLQLETFKGAPVLLSKQAETLLQTMRPIADLLDQACQTDRYQKAWAAQLASVEDPTQTLSAKMLQQIGEGDNANLALNLAQRYRSQMLESEFELFSEADFQLWAEQSLTQQREIEVNDNQSFDEYLASYFSR